VLNMLLLVVVEEEVHLLGMVAVVEVLEVI
jgi:hypothetical protein